MALLWAAGIIYFAIQVAVPDDTADGNSAANATDVTGAPVTAADEKALKDAINSI